MFWATLLVTWGRDTFKYDQSNQGMEHIRYRAHNTISGQISIVNGEKCYCIVPGKCPYPHKCPSFYFGCFVVWAVLRELLVLAMVLVSRLYGSSKTKVNSKITSACV